MLYPHFRNFEKLQVNFGVSCFLWTWFFNLAGNMNDRIAIPTWIRPQPLCVLKFKVMCWIWLMNKSAPEEDLRFVSDQHWRYIYV